MARKRLGWKDNNVNKAAENLLYAVLQQAVEDFRRLALMGIIKNGALDLMRLNRLKEGRSKYKYIFFGLSATQIQELIWLFSSGYAGKILKWLGSDINPVAMVKALGFR